MYRKDWKQLMRAWLGTMRGRILLAICVVVVVAIGVEGYASAVSRAWGVLLVRPVYSNVEAVRTVIGERIDAVGAEAAYQEFIHYNQAGSSADQHNLAHIFGDLLYEKKGAAGVSVCDSSFSYGCYHSVLGFTVATEGVGSLSDLFRLCQSASRAGAGACQHGLGHGILIYTGYNHLREALELCASIASASHELCYDGVFMEFNKPGFLTVADRTLRQPVVGEGLFYPCSILPQQFLQACYRALPEWWVPLLGKNYHEVGKRCAQIPDTQLRATCFRSIGSFASIFLTGDAVALARVCLAMPSVSERSLCQEGMLSSLWRSTLSPETGRKLCETMPLSLEETCLKELETASER